MKGRKTLTISLGAFVTAVVGLITHYTGEIALSPEMLGVFWSTVVWMIVMAGMRMVSDGKARLGRGPADPPDSPGGPDSLRLLVLLVVMALGACAGPIRAEKTVGWHAATIDGVCHVTLVVDGKRVDGCRITKKGPCKIECQDARKPAP